MGVHLYTNGAWTDSGKIYRNSLNIFDKSQTPYSTTGFIAREGTLTEYAAWCVSDYVEVLSNTEYTLSGMNINAIYPAICFYTDNKIYISGIRYNQQSTLTFTTPENCKYVLISYLTAKLDTVMLNAGSIALPYEPYNIVDWYTNNGHGYTSGAWS